MPSLCAATAQQPSARRPCAPQTAGRPTPCRDNATRAAAPPAPSHSPQTRAAAAAARSSSAALGAAVLRVRRAPACAAPGASAARPVAQRPRSPGQRWRRGAGMVAAPRPLLGCRQSARSSLGRCRAPAPRRRAGASEIPERGRLGSRRLCAPTRTVRGRDPSREAAPARLRSAGRRVSAPPFLMLLPGFDQ